MSSFPRRDFLRGAATLAGASLLPLTRLAQAQTKVPATPKAPQLARGVVFLDQTGTGKRAANAPGVPNVRVSNGRDIVATDVRGRFQLPVDDDTIIFLQKPSGFRVPLDSHNQPRFYHVHKPLGSPTNFKYAGFAPTGELPASIDFALQPQAEPNTFRALLWGDPQPRNLEEVDFLARDIAQELVGVQAAFGLSLGDNAFNNLETLAALQDVTAQLGIPWHSLLGNHDLNFEATSDVFAAETFKRHFGPTYYSFDYGSAHFVVLDNVVWLGPDPVLKSANYTGGFGEKQLAWLQNDLAGVPRDKLVVLLMHIPIATPREMPVPDVAGKPARFIESERRAFLQLLADRPHTLSISGHTHVQYHAFLGREDGWNGREPHHHFNCGTTSGSWWSGAPDEQGIPNTTMRDGVPNGYAFLNVNGSDFTLDWQAARSRPDHQMTVYAPASVEANQSAGAPLAVNVFNGCEKTRVEMRVGNQKWQSMARVCEPDPGYVGLKRVEGSIPAFETKAKTGKPWRALPAIEVTPHLWRATLPPLETGAHTVEVRATDQWNRTFSARRVVRVV